MQLHTDTIVYKKSCLLQSKACISYVLYKDKMLQVPSEFYTGPGFIVNT